MDMSPTPTPACFAYNAILGGNEDLQPETATTRTIGIVLQPRFLRGFNATIDWWDIKLKGAISKIGAQAIVDSCVASGDPIFCSRIHRDPNGSLWLGNGYVDDRQANLGGLKVRGIDGSADYSVPPGPPGLGKLRISRQLRSALDRRQWRAFDALRLCRPVRRPLRHAAALEAHGSSHVGHVRMEFRCRSNGGTWVA